MARSEDGIGVSTGGGGEVRTGRGGAKKGREALIVEVEAEAMRAERWAKAKALAKAKKGCRT